MYFADTNSWCDTGKKNDRDKYIVLLENLFYSKQNFEEKLKIILDFLKSCFYKSIKYERLYDEEYNKFDYTVARFPSLDLFSIVLIKNKSFLPLLKEHKIKSTNSRRVFTPVYDPLMSRDVDAVDYLVKNGCDIITNTGFCFFDFYREDRKDMIDILLDEKITTSVRYIYENTPIENILQCEARNNFMKYVYDHILPY